MPSLPPSCGEPEPATVERRARLLVDGPSRVLSDERTNGADRRIVSRNGRRLAYFERGDVVGQTAGARDSETFPSGLASATHLLDPQFIPDSLDLRVLGAQRLSSGPAAVLEGRSREGQGPVVGGIGEDDVRLWIDLDSGIVARVEYRLGGRVFLRTTLDDLVLGRPIPRSRFAFRPPRGARVLRPTDLRYRATTPARGAAEVGFALFAPPGVDDAAGIRPAEVGVSGPVVTMFTTSGADIRQHAEGPSDRCRYAAGRIIERDRLRVSVVGEGPANALVLVLREGTAVTIQGFGSADQVADLAASMVRLG